MAQTELVKENYVTMSFNHGTNPTDANYEYVLLPNATKESTKKFAVKRSIQVLENSTDVHAVRDLHAKVQELTIGRMNLSKLPGTLKMIAKEVLLQIKRDPLS